MVRQREEHFCKVQCVQVGVRKPSPKQPTPNKTPAILTLLVLVLMEGVLNFSSLHRDVSLRVSKAGLAQSRSFLLLAILILFRLCQAPGFLSHPVRDVGCDGTHLLCPFHMEHLVIKEDVWANLLQQGSLGGAG